MAASTDSNYFQALPLQIVSIILEDAVIFPTSLEKGRIKREKRHKEMLRTVCSVSLVCKLFSRILFGRRFFPFPNETPIAATVVYDDISQRIWEHLAEERWLTKVSQHVRNWRKFYRNRQAFQGENDHFSNCWICRHIAANEQVAVDNCLEWEFK
jgi:hypothetical protein